MQAAVVLAAQLQDAKIMKMLTMKITLRDFTNWIKCRTLESKSNRASSMRITGVTRKISRQWCSHRPISWCVRTLSNRKDIACRSRIKKALQVQIRVQFQGMLSVLDVNLMENCSQWITTGWIAEVPRRSWVSKGTRGSLILRIKCSRLITLKMLSQSHNGSKLRTNLLTK